MTFDTYQQLSAIICPNKYVQRHSSDKGWLFHQNKLVTRVLEANKKQVPLKSYSPKIRIDSVNQILKNKGKVT